ncbi:MAG: transglycosylase SLT domain-containing protein [Bacteroides sp.]|nr:transglycosylase SLT domain-containing protein [Prevotella sp.]MCM1406898.1 transglycosylase SLT domain-containing protein [Treponema brennaborense]MCM1470049.1 transglycosylase SLT domain-containing protein [Bacteroides sp.]
MQSIDLDTAAAEISSIRHDETQQNTQDGTADTDTENFVSADAISAAEKPPEKTHIDIGIPIPEDNIYVQKYRTEYLSNYGKKWLDAVMQRAAPYRSYIRSALKEMGLPECLEYLPVIESDFNTHAVSKSGAKGLWQFMENSMGPYLKKDEWRDERLDPWKSTQAALKKLKENYETFKSWETALAAYNCGGGSMSRIIKKAGSADYWELAENGFFTKQTQLYVPKFLVIADLLANTEFYGIELSDSAENDSIEYTEYVINGSVPLFHISSKSNIPHEVLAFLNPSLIRGCTPPDMHYALRIPAGAEPLVKDALKELAGSTYISYTVKKGDTLWALSRKYQIPLADLYSANNLNENSILSIGKVLNIPIHNTDR